jgi:acetate kinase
MGILEWMDEAKNEKDPRNARNKWHSKTKIMVIPTNEEMEMPIKFMIFLS